MNFTQLKNAVTAAECGSMNRAAAELFITQPCLSNSVKALEREIGFEIFRRSRGGVTLTQKGAEFVRIAGEILDKYEALSALSGEGKPRPLRIVSYPLSYLSDSFLRFHKGDHAELSDTFREAGNFEVLDEVASQRAGLGFVFFEAGRMERLEALTEKYGLKYETLFAPITMYAVAHYSHPIAKLSKISLAQLKRYPMVMFNDPSTQHFMQKLNTKMHPGSLFTPDRRILFDALRSGEYVSTITVSSRSKSNDFVYVPIDDPRFLMGLYCVVPKVAGIAGRERAFLRFLKKDISLL